LHTAELAELQIARAIAHVSAQIFVQNIPDLKADEQYLSFAITLSI
jgi:hypothetical protein